MSKDIAGKPIKPTEKPPHNGACPKCGGTIKKDGIVGWKCKSCNKDFGGLPRIIKE